MPRIKGCRYNESNIQLQFEKLEYPISIAIQDYRLASEEEKEILFDAIKANGYKWNAETKTLEKLHESKFKVGDRDKFDITTLKPFDKVLIRLTNNCVWMPKLFSHYDTGPNVKYYPFVTTDNIGYPQCIPYNGNEHLCRKTDDCDDFYKTWE